MSGGRRTPRHMLNLLVVALHVLAGLAAVAVPAFAIADAAGSLLRPPWRWTAAAEVPADDLARLLDLDRWRVLLLNTGLVGGIAVLVAVGGGAAAALIATRTDLPGRRLVLGAALLGACVPAYVTLVFVFSAVPLVTVLNSPWAAGVLAGILHAPLATLVCGVALRAADPEPEQHARLDATPRQVLVHVTLPSAGWGVAAAAVLVFLLVSTDTTVPDLLAVRTFAEEVRSQYTLGGRRAGPLLTGLPVLLVLAAGLAVFAARWGGPGRSNPASDQSAFVYRLGRGRALLLAGLVLLAGAAAVPVGALARRLPAPADLPAVLRDIQPEVGHSGAAAATAATIMLLPAAGLAWWLVHGWGRTAGWGALLALLATPAPVIGISLIALFNDPALPAWLYDSPLPVLAAYFVRFLPVAVLLLLPGVHRIPRELEWAARADGCNWRQAHWHVRWPMLRRDLAVTWLIVLVLCFAEISTAVLLAPPAFPLASVRIFTLLHFGVYQDVAVLAAAAALAMLLPGALLCALLRRFGQRPARDRARVDYG